MFDNIKEPLCAKCGHEEDTHLSDYAVPTECQCNNCCCVRFIPPFDGWIGIYGIYKL